jgi:hypothetical protein
MVVTGDIAELVNDTSDMASSVRVNKELPAFEQPSMMLFNNYNCQKLTPEYVQSGANKMFDMAWADHGIGSFDPAWNVLCGYGEKRMDGKLYHLTRGLPIWKETTGENGTPQDKIWLKEAKIAVSSVSHAELMGGSVHTLSKVS